VSELSASMGGGRLLFLLLVLVVVVVVVFVPRPAVAPRFHSPAARLRLASSSRPFPSVEF
jgi:hypothetical protein